MLVAAQQFLYRRMARSRAAQQDIYHQRLPDSIETRYVRKTCYCSLLANLSLHARGKMCTLNSLQPLDMSVNSMREKYTPEAGVPCASNATFFLSFATILLAARGLVHRTWWAWTASAEETNTRALAISRMDARAEVRAKTTFDDSIAPYGAVPAGQAATPIHIA
jgi:hypothetical protein